MKKLLIVTTFVALAFSLVFYFGNQKPLFVESVKSTTDEPTYKQGGNINLDVGIFDNDIKQVTQIEFTPDGKYMLVGTLSGTVWIYHKLDGIFKKQSQPFYVLKTAQPGFPPEEAGLTGIVLGSDFGKSGDIFLNYSYAFKKKSFRNRVTRVTFTKVGEKVLGKKAKEIFEANTEGSGAHQIQDGVGIEVGGKPHLLFTIGEGFKSERALDVTQEAGKIMLIQRDGSVPVGERPFPNYPKVQALGIRNAPAIGINPESGKIAIGDTGPDNYDRFIYGAFYREDGSNNKQLSLNWDGTEDSLKKGAPDLYNSNKEMILHRWAPTNTAVNIVFYRNDKLPKLKDSQHYVLVDLFGRTGEKSNSPGKRILLGVITEGNKNSLSLSTLIDRTAKGEGQLGHPIGLAVDPSTKDIYFGDIMEGKIYKASIK